MRACIQRTARASVTVDGAITGAIGPGLLILLGIRSDDTEEEARFLASRTASLRVFNDTDGKMNLSVQDIRGSALVVSQFTLHADTRKGNRPSYAHAATPEQAEHLYDVFVDALRNILGPTRVATGVFRAMMQVELVNDGPVTILLHSKNEYSSAAGERPHAL